MKDSAEPGPVGRGAFDRSRDSCVSITFGGRTTDFRVGVDESGGIDLVRVGPDVEQVVPGVDPRDELMTAISRRLSGFLAKLPEELAVGHPVQAMQDLVTGHPGEPEVYTRVVELLLGGLATFDARHRPHSITRLQDDCSIGRCRHRGLRECQQHSRTITVCRSCYEHMNEVLFRTTQVTDVNAIPDWVMWPCAERCALSESQYTAATSLGVPEGVL